MQSELKLVKEFRRKRALMQSELDDIRESLFNANREHKDSLQKMEHKVCHLSTLLCDALIAPVKQILSTCKSQGNYFFLEKSRKILKPKNVVVNINKT